MENEKDYEFLDIRRPAVILAYSVNEDRDQLVPKKNIKIGSVPVVFRKICHQCSGLMCAHMYFKAAILPFASDRMERRWDLWCKANYDGDLMLGATLGEVNKYEAFLKDMAPALSCNTSYRDLTEAVYPVDCTKDSLRIITGLRIKEDFDDAFLKWDKKKPLNRIMGCLNRWRLYVICENSD